MASTLGNTIEFLSDFGFFDVIIPFLLFFAIIYAILEKTSLLGKDKSNVNLIVSLAVSFLAVATNKVINLISSVLPNMILMLVLFVMFVMILGLFFKQGEMEFASEHSGWFKFFMFLLFFLTLIFILNAWPSDSGDSMLESVVDAIGSGSSGELIGGIVMLAIIVGAIALVVRTKPKKDDEEG
jgi:hypothetical protein